MIIRFARPIPQICMIRDIIMSHIYEDFLHLLSDFNQQWFSPESLSSFANVIRRKGD